VYVDNLRTRCVTACLIVAVCAAVGTAAAGVAAFVQTETAFAKENLIRLHVIANSDSPQDQDLKLLVRDAVLAETRELFAAVTSKEEARRLLAEHQEKVIEAAEEVIQAHGFSYNVSLEMGAYAFPSRAYRGITLPAGTYDAVRVRIGDAQGENWWCVLFPPLCLGELEVSSGQSELAQYNPQGETGKIAFRLKVLEYIQATYYGQQIRNWWQASAAGLTRWNTQ
jgi:stage II sporulation protein R